jgi:hypothetical protein
MQGMSTQMRQRIRQEVELIQRFSGSYGKKFDQMIAQMNGPEGTTDATANAAINPDTRCLRLCIEAVNMVLSMQGNLARVLDDMSRENPKTIQ